MQSTLRALVPLVAAPMAAVAGIAAVVPAKVGAAREADPMAAVVAVADGDAPAGKTKGSRTANAPTGGTRPRAASAKPSTADAAQPRRQQLALALQLEP